MWTIEQKLHAAVRAPIGREILRDDTVFVDRPGWSQLITPSMPWGSGYLNEIAISEVDEADAERVIDETIATYQQNGHPVKWYVGPWTKPEGFGERLARRGFARSEIVAMGISTSASIAPSPGIVVREVMGADLPAYTDCSLRGWGMDLDQAPLEVRSHARGMKLGARFFFATLATLAEPMIGTAGLFLRPAVPESDAFGYLVGTQVREQARGRGAYRALVAARLQWLAAQGIAYAVTHASATTSAPILERLGFETLMRTQVYFLSAPATRK